MHAKIFSATTIGVKAHAVEVDVSLGLINFYIVGLPDTAIKESSKRIQTALKNSGIRLPAKRITVNLAPADLKKEGTLFDLPIAIGILCATDHITLPTALLQETLFIGELSLDGSIRPIKGALPIAFDAHTLGKKRIILPSANAHEAALINDVEVIGVNHITQLIAYLKHEITIEPTRNQFIHTKHARTTMNIDFCQVKGQFQAKRALQIAAAGRHNILFIGPPGSGKTMLAKRLPTIMPALSFSEILETSKVYSISGHLGAQSLITKRPFRDPHHTVSQAGLIGGGSHPRPGEISLAHNGILFLDELTEFKRTTLEVLRQPLEEGTIRITRVHHATQLPASFLLVAALNPCPCGFFGDATKQCVCSQHHIDRYLDKLSGPLLDRIDLQVGVEAVDYATITTKSAPTSSEQMFKAVKQALLQQEQRFNSSDIFNAQMTVDQIEQYCITTPEAEQLIKQLFSKLNLSMRGYHKLLKVARTIADLENSTLIDLPHVQEASMYRSLDKTLEGRRS